MKTKLMTQSLIGKRKKLFFISFMFLFTIGIICYFFLYVKAPTSNIELNGKNTEEIIKIKGIPTRIDEFIISDSSMYEYRYGLYKYFASELTKTKKILIREYYWKSVLFNSAVWFYKENGNWISVDNLTWSNLIFF